MAKKHNPNKQGVLSEAVSPPKTPTIDVFEERSENKIVGPLKGEFVPPPEVEEGDERIDALPEQEEFWRPPVRFGSVPIEKEPLGWDRRRGFRKLFPIVSLPTQVVERISFGHPQLEPNRLFWGDNLHVMRQLPSESVDVIYIDPPFFSGRHYNVIFGDQNELRSFSDIWEGGMPGYLVWLNARIYEMRRLLRRTGSMFVHLDWHASHYVKMEMDKIFGVNNFVNEIVWYYSNKITDSRKRIFQRSHDVILFYCKSKEYKWNPPYEKRDEPVKNKKVIKVDGKRVNARDEDGNIIYVETEIKSMLDVWDVPVLGSRAIERIGYPTQKPEEVLNRIISSTTNEGDVVADFFCGGGTTPVMAQRLGRKWIACDQSRVAAAITADRMSGIVEKELGGLFRVPDFTTEHWGIYEVDRLSKMPIGQFRAFIVRAFGAVPVDEIGNIHGYKGAIPIWVGEPSQRTSVTAKDVEDFANATRKTLRYQQDNLRDGTMLAWAFRPDAVKAAERLREMEQTELNFIRLEQLRIDSPPFREHIAALSTDHADYASFLTFVQPPKVEVGWKCISNLSFKFDVSETAVLNAGAKIINVQWDFDYEKRFNSTPGYSFIRGLKKEPMLQAQYDFPHTGKFRIACKVQDDMGGEGLWTGEVEVS